MQTGPENKLLPTLKGPARIIEKLNDSRYRIEDLVTRRAKDYHVSAIIMDLEEREAPHSFSTRYATIMTTFRSRKSLRIEGNPAVDQTCPSKYIGLDLQNRLGNREIQFCVP